MIKGIKFKKEIIANKIKQASIINANKMASCVGTNLDLYCRY